MDIFNLFAGKIRSAVQQLSLNSRDDKPIMFSRVSVEIPRERHHGDLSTNVALVLSNAFGIKPKELAGLIVSKLKMDTAISSIEVAGAGFINFRISPSVWHAVLAEILTQKSHYGRLDLGKNSKVNIEFVSANPTGPLHVGHCRGAVVGDVLSNLLQFVGYQVTREYYMNDAGNQVNILAQSVFLRYREALGEPIINFPENLYPGNYLVEVGQNLAKRYGTELLQLDKKEALSRIKTFSLKAMMALICEDLTLLKIQHDSFFSEQTLHANNAKPISHLIDELTLKGYVYRGKLPAPKGQVTEDWEDREQLLFSSTKVGDDMDRPLVKSDGSYTYFAADMAYLKDKYLRGFEKMIYVLGADHGGYIKRLEAVSKAIFGEDGHLKVLVCQLVRLMRNGNPLRMSKRTGNFVTLREVVQEVGSDATRFMMISRKTDVPLDFDFVKITEQSKDNPVFYVQYAYARCHSILRQAEEKVKAFSSKYEPSDFIVYISFLKRQEELDLIKKLCEYPQIIKSSAQNQEPHKLPYYLYDLASIFHGYWNKGNEDTSLRFILLEDKNLTFARIGLIKALIIVLESGMDLIGISKLKEMR